MWQRHWNLTADPFLGTASPFVRTPTHAEALARLIASVESGQRLAIMSGAEGLGKSVVLEALVKELKTPRHRFARISGPVDGEALFQGMARGLGMRVPVGPARGTAWKALCDAIKLSRAQKQHVVMVVDDAQTLESRADVRDLERLARIDPHPETRLSVIVAVTEAGETMALGSSEWLLAIRLLPLTRSETLHYVREKLAEAGRSDPAFTPRALTRLHDLTGGVPRGLDRLASLSLMAGAVRGLEVIGPDVLEGVARECLRADPWTGTAA